MKPDFNAMSRELLTPTSKNIEPTMKPGVFFLDQRNPNAKQYPAPLDGGMRIMEEAFRAKIQEIELGDPSK